MVYELTFEKTTAFQTHVTMKSVSVVHGDLSKPDWYNSANWVQIHQYFVHPDYVAGDRESLDDIALI